jgi:two-component system, OmpR family, response regulator
VCLVADADRFIFFSSNGSSIGRGVSAVRLLVVEDSVKMAAVLRRGLEEEGYAVDVALTGEQGLWMAVEYPNDVIVLDVMLPDMDGFELCRRLRERGQWAPVLMLTARGAVADRVRGLDAGADDYLTKPFSFHELAARTRALVRRGVSERPARLMAGDLSLDPATRAAHRGGVALQLSAKEFALLEYFMRHPGEVLSRTRLIEHVWDFAYDGGSNIVDVYVRYLREKIDRPFGAHSLETVRGAGYRLRGDSADARAG